jgi:single-strand DNA-binding protein
MRGIFKMLNKVILMGRLTKDPELRYTPGTGNAVARYSIAVDRNTKNGEVDFINIVAWGKNAEFASNYLKRGVLIIVEGKLQMNKWTDNNGQGRTTYEVIVESHQFIPRSKAQSDSTESSNDFENQSMPPNNNTNFENINSSGDSDFELLNGVDEKDLPF